MIEWKSHFSKVSTRCMWIVAITIYGVGMMSLHASGRLSPLWNLSRENVFFVGRTAELQKMNKFFKGRKGKTFAITGGPGFGKTQIAKRYAQNSLSDYDLIWWIDTQQDIAHQYGRLALALNKYLPKQEEIIPARLSKEALVDAVKQVLSLKKLKYLLIFDNAEDYSQIEKFLPFSPGFGKQHVLLTSRNANIWPDKIEIGKFKREDSLLLIKNALPKEKLKEREKLAEILGDYPLGLTISVAFIKAHPTTTINKYLAGYLKKAVHFSKQKDGFIKTSGPLLNSYANDAQAALSISLRAIEEESPDALKTLFFMSFLNSKDIPEPYINIWLKKTKSKLTSAEVIRVIYDQSLLDIRRSHEEDKEPLHFLSLHDLIHQLIHEGMTVEDKKNLIENATGVMLEVFAGPSSQFTKKIVKEPIHLLHAQKLCEQAKQINYSSPALLTLKICIFQCLMSGVRDFEKAQKIRDEIDADFKTGIKVDPYYEGICQHNKGFLEAVHTNFDEAIRYVQEGLTIFENTGFHPNETLSALNNLIQFHVMRGELEKAASFVPKAREKLEKADSPILKSSFLYVLALLLLDEGKFQEAEDVLSQVSEFPTLAEDSPPIYHGILLVKTICLSKQRKLEELEKALKEYESTTNTFFQGRNNSALSHILLLKSLAEMQQGKVTSKTLPNLTEALSVYNIFFNGEKKQRFQARTYFAIGKAHELQHDYPKSLENYLISNEIYDRVLKNKQIDDVSELYTSIAFLGLKLKNEELVQQYLKIHINTFGLDHLRTKEIVKELDERQLPCF